MAGLALLFAAALLIVPFVALALAIQAINRLKSRTPDSLGGQIETLRSQAMALELHVRRLTARLAKLEAPVEPAGTEPALPAQVPPAREEEIDAPPVEPPPTTAPAGLQPAEPAEPAPAMQPAPAPAPVFATPLPPARSLEERIGARWATWAGIIVLVFAVGFFVREMFARNLIGYTARVAIGIGTGLAMVAGGLAIRRRPGLPYLSVGLTGGGLAILYLSLFAGYNLYHLYSAEAAFGAMAAVTGGGAIIATLSGQLPLAVLAVTGGLLTPILAHRPDADERVLFSYLIVLDLMVLGVSRRRSWPVLNRLAWAGSVVLLLPMFVRGDMAPDPASRLALLTGLFAIFLALPVLRAWLDGLSSEPLDLMLVVANGTLYFAAIYATLEDFRPGLEPWWAVALAAVYLGIGAAHRVRVPDDEATPTVHFGAAAALMVVAAALMFDGPWVTVAWAAEAALLVVLAPRTPQRDAALSGASMLFAGAIARAIYLDRFWFPVEKHFLNAVFGSGVFVVAALVYAGAVASRVSDFGDKLRSVLWLAASLVAAALLWSEPTGAWPGVLLSILVVVLALLVERTGDDAFRVGAASVAGIALIRLFVWDGGFATGAADRLINPFSIARVLCAVAIGVAGEILRRASVSEASRKLGRVLLGAAWLTLLVALSESWFLYSGRQMRAHPDLANGLRYKMQLGLSALWAVYAGISLALGFAWSKAALRYAALGLLGLTLAKVFLIDLSEVQTIWRILSFLVLGLVLLAVSVVYQRRMK